METYSGVTFQVKVPNFKKSIQWYTDFLGRNPDFVPHQGFAEWQITPNAWLQVGKEKPEICRPIRFGVKDIKKYRRWLQKTLKVRVSKITLVPGVVLWCDFSDPFGNKLGLFQDLRAPLFTFLTPILFVKKLDAERRFYEKLGFKISYQGNEFPNFIGLKYGETIEFGLEKKDNFDINQVENKFVWQISAHDLKRIIEICKQNDIKVLQRPRAVWKEQSLWEMKVKSPNGYEVVFEGAMS